MDYFPGGRPEGKAQGREGVLRGRYRFDALGNVDQKDLLSANESQLVVSDEIHLISHRDGKVATREAGLLNRGHRSAFKRDRGQIKVRFLGSFVLQPEEQN